MPLFAPQMVRHHEVRHDGLGNGLHISQSNQTI
jgi:hypothetical protein